MFLSRTHGLDLWITNEGPVYEFQKFVQTGPSQKASPTPGYLEGHVVKMTFVNAKPTAVSGSGQTSAKFNYYVGKDQSRWISAAPSYSEAVAEQPYSGISVHYSTELGKPRYDVVVKPGADVSQVGIKIEGADGVQTTSDGNLLLKTSLGNIKEGGLAAYQDTSAGRTQVPCRMVLDGNTVHFDLGAYDTSKPLVIDPLVCSTFLQGSSTASITGVATDSGNDIFVTGYASVGVFPTTTGAFHTTDTNRLDAAFVSRMNSAETGLFFSTYIAGSSLTTGDFSYAIALDGAANAYIAGTAGSTDFPTTTGAYNRTNTVNQSDAFVSKFTPAGALSFSTLLAPGTPTGIAVVTADNEPVVTGYTYDTTFPTTTGALKKTTTAYGTGFVTRFNPTGTALIFSTYLGGSGSDKPEAIKIDASGNPTIAGDTTSADFPVTTGVFMKTDPNASPYSGNTSGFVAKINPLGTALVLGTYIGGSVLDSVQDLAIDTTGNITLVGYTSSPNFPITVGAFLPLFPPTGGTGAGAESAFVSKLNSTGTTLVASTFLGGSNPAGDYIYNTHDQATAVAVDGSGNAIVGGTSDTVDFPVTAGAFDILNTGQSGFLAKVGSTGTTLLYSTFINGFNASDQDTVSSVALNAAGNAVVGGNTYDSNFPITTGTFENGSGGGSFIGTFNLVSGTTGTINVQLVPSTIVGGDYSVCKIALTNAASAPVTFTVTGPAILSFVSTFAIPQGASSYAFEIATSPVTANTSAVINVVSGSFSKALTLTLTPPVMYEIYLGAATVRGGASVPGELYLDGYAGKSGALVSMTTTNPAIATTATTCLVPSSARIGYFSVQTKAVSADTTVTLSGSFGGVIKGVTLAVQSARLAAVTAAATVIGGNSLTGKVTLSSPAGPSGDVVTLKSNSASALVPVSVTVPAGATTASFTITTKAVTVNAAAIITGAFAGVSQSTTVEVEK
jgi:hypothetical protein